MPRASLRRCSSRAFARASRTGASRSPASTSSNGSASTSGSFGRSFASSSFAARCAVLSCAAQVLKPSSPWWVASGKAPSTVSSMKVSLRLSPPVTISMSDLRGSLSTSANARCGPSASKVLLRFLSSRRTVRTFASRPVETSRSLGSFASAFGEGRKANAVAPPAWPVSPSPRTSDSTAPSRYQKRTVPSSPVDARRPSRGVKASAVTAPRCPSISRGCFCPKVKTRTTPSSPAAATRLFGASSATARWGPGARNSYFFAPSDQTVTLPSTPVLASSAPETASEVTPPWCACEAPPASPEAKSKRSSCPSVPPTTTCLPRKASAAVCVGTARVRVTLRVPASKSVTAEVPSARVPPMARSRPLAASARTCSRCPIA